MWEARRQAECNFVSGDRPEVVLGKVDGIVSFGGVREAVNGGWKAKTDYTVNFAENYFGPDCFENFAENSVDSLLVSSRRFGTALATLSRGRVRVGPTEVSAQTMYSWEA